MIESFDRRGIPDGVRHSPFLARAVERRCFPRSPRRETTPARPTAPNDEGHEAHAPRVSTRQPKVRKPSRLSGSFQRGGGKHRRRAHGPLPCERVAVTARCDNGSRSRGSLDADGSRSIHGTRPRRRRGWRPFSLRRGQPARTARDGPSPCAALPWRGAASIQVWRTPWSAT